MELGRIFALSEGQRMAIPIMNLIDKHREEGVDIPGNNTKGG